MAKYSEYRSVSREIDDTQMYKKRYIHRIYHYRILAEYKNICDESKIKQTEYKVEYTNIS